MRSPSRSEIAENWTGPDYQDETDWTKCDKCDEEFDREDMFLHEDGNTYCADCVYLTPEDYRDGEADRANDEARDDG